MRVDFAALACLLALSAIAAPAVPFNTHNSTQAFQKNPSGGIQQVVAKQSGIYDAQVWSQVTWLAELCERCTLQGDFSSTEGDARDLVDGAGWLIKNTF